MDKTRYFKRDEYKLFGFKIFEKETQYEDCFLEDLDAEDKTVELPLRFENVIDKKNKNEL